jgi:hypothetical protein
MATMTTGSFTSSAVTTLDGWRAFVEHDREPMDLLDASELSRLTPAEKTAYDDERSDYHAELPALRTPVLDRTVTKGLLFLRLNRGQQMGTPCGMILSGVPGVGKTTAVKALGRTVEHCLPEEEPAYDRHGARGLHHHANRAAPQGPARRTAVLPRRAECAQDERDGAHPPGMSADDRPQDQPGHRR